jgi:hypothetical protein
MPGIATRNALNHLKSDVDELKGQRRKFWPRVLEDGIQPTVHGLLVVQTAAPLQPTRG